MIYVGLDDTDTLDTPGTNQLARHLVRQVTGDWEGRMIVRHQLLEHPDVPCTRKNGCASILLEARRTAASVRELAGQLRRIILDWRPAGSDPGLCIAEAIPPTIIEWGNRCKRELVSQADAWRLASENRLYLEGLGGTNDGVIGALAAIGLVATGDDGRIVHLGSRGQDLLDVGGPLTVEQILALGVAEIRDVNAGECLTAGTVDVGKRLRPNYRGGRAVLYAAKVSEAMWKAERVA